jgi:ABC-type lipoprotein release transport system permease subunit
MIKQGTVLAAIGAAVGLAAAYMSGRVVSSWLYEVRASDPLILGAATVIVVGIALLATTVPASRAAHLDPSRTLRPD